MNNIRVLAVDDQTAMRDLLSHFLKSAGYDVFIGEDGEQAWDILQNRAGTFDVVISDRMMPNMNGLELLRKMKEDQRFADIPVILQTAMIKENEIIEGIQAGAYYYLAKPYDFQLLSTLVANAVNDSRRHRQLRIAALEQLNCMNFLRKGEFHCSNLHEVHQLAPMLAQLFPEPQRVVLGLTELMLNGIEHGNLRVTYKEKSELLAAGTWLEELDRRAQLAENQEKYIAVRYKKDKYQITVTIEDQGNGFEHQKYMDFDTERVTHTHGRGIALSKLLSFDALEYQGCGNRVRASILI